MSDLLASCHVCFRRRHDADLLLHCFAAACYCLLEAVQSVSARHERGQSPSSACGHWLSGTIEPAVQL